MVEVDKVPDVRRGRKRAPHVEQLTEFMASGKARVLLPDVPESKRESTYKGLFRASRRGQFYGKVRVSLNWEGIYLERLG